MKVAKAKGKLKGRAPKLSARQEAHLVKLYQEGAHTTRELAEMLGVARSSVYAGSASGSQGQLRTSCPLPGANALNLT